MPEARCGDMTRSQKPDLGILNDNILPSSQEAVLGIPSSLLEAIDNDISNRPPDGVNFSYLDTVEAVSYRGASAYETIVKGQVGIGLACDNPPTNE